MQNGRETKVKALLVEYERMASDLAALKETSGVSELEHSLAVIKAEIERLTIAHGASIRGGNGWQAVLSPGREYGAWDDKALCAFAAGLDTELGARLLALRETKRRAPSVAVRRTS